ncbi:MAG: glyoxylate/hydroxypyruvate reductase A [Alphaproteobacteria bacterium]|nr:glyoxylate/hydroxypyruvate reductase A [Alphaproteobacteria bacterium]
MADPITLLLDVPSGWAGHWAGPLSELLPGARLLRQDEGPIDTARVDYLITFRPRKGLIASLANLKAVFSLGAGVDGILADPDFPRDIPLMRFVDRSLSRELAQYVVMHVLIFHRGQRYFDAAQAMNKWRQRPLLRPTEDTRIGILGMGEIGTMCAERLRDLDFPVTGWSRTRKSVTGVESFSGAGELAPFLARSDILVCLLPLTPETKGILNAKTFALLPRGAFVINAARGGHLIEADLVEAIDTGHLAGATLDVFQHEPLPADSVLWNHPKITVTPHIAAITDPRAAARAISEGITALERGEPAAHRVNIARGY